jgi:murein DD-endopeptidase MepM/ murein hydrolase activator NlpD
MNPVPARLIRWRRSVLLGLCLAALVPLASGALDQTTAIEYSDISMNPADLAGQPDLPGAPRSELERPARKEMEQPGAAIEDETLAPGTGRGAEVPLRFTFPSSAAPPISAWRPALYPVPWALTPFDHFYFLRPIQADEVNWPNADYRYGGVFFEDVVHTGVDIPAKSGTPVLAAAAGKVAWAGYGLYSGYYDEADPYGIAVLIRHDFGYKGARLYTVYAHLSRVDVVKGQRVEAGSRLGLSGETGKTTGPHLHFEVRQEVDGFFSTYNPELWLVPPQGWGVVAGRVMNTGGLKLKGQLVQVRSLTGGQIWKAFTYSGGNTHEDLYYRENVVISDLPAGRYEIRINYLGKNYSLEVEVQPGLVTYFTFRGRSGYTSEPLKTPGADFNPLVDP